MSDGHAKQRDRAEQQQWWRDESVLGAESGLRERTRNFAVVAHVDHGKSTLCDRLMEMSGAILHATAPGDGGGQYLDTLPVERQRGITVKAQTCSIAHHEPATNSLPYILNLIDTPGHVDFSYEVRRSLSAVQGAILLVDATQGVQAQTIATCLAARELGLSLIPVLNKMDMQTADPARCAAQLAEVLDFDVEGADRPIAVSAKTGAGVREELLPALVRRLPAPGGDASKPLRALVVDSSYDSFRGVVSVMRIFDGEMRRGDRVRFCATGESFDVQEVGVLTPGPQPTDALRCGQVGYVICGIRSLKSVRVGDTVAMASEGADVQALAGVAPSKPMVWAGIFPASATDFEPLRSAIGRLTLNDNAVEVKKESSAALGAGFRCGFLGVLHLDVFHQRLKQEHDADVIVTAPSVEFRAQLSNGTEVACVTPADISERVPKGAKLVSMSEPVVHATIVCSSEHVGKVLALCSDRRGELLEHRALSTGDGGGGSADGVFLQYQLPLAEIAFTFYDALKSCSSGHATFDYEEMGYEQADLVPLNVLINGTEVDALAKIVHRSNAHRIGKSICERLKTLLPRQQFETRIQAAIGNKVIAAASISQLRKNVLAKCYGGDVSRKRKLLEKQKAGKKRMRSLGSVAVPHEALFDILRQA